MLMCQMAVGKQQPGQPTRTGEDEPNNMTVMMVTRKRAAGVVAKGGAKVGHLLGMNNCEALKCENANTNRSRNLIINAETSKGKKGGAAHG
jgi:hypothetical protein